MTCTESLCILERLMRPLGRGVLDLPALIEQFSAPAADAPGANPNVQRSLEAFARLPELGRWLRRLPPAPSVLIEGYSDPGNADALRGFLRGRVDGEAQVQTIDLFDLPAVYALLGLPTPDIGFRVADASDLSAHFADRSVDVVVQDFLLNCAPATLHAPILREVARILSARGLALISFTDRSGVRARPTLDVAEFEERFGRPWQPEAYNLSDLFPSGSPAESPLVKLGGCVIYEPVSETATLVTQPSGRFEFFRDAEAMHRLFQSSALVCRGVDQSEGVDAQGLRCTRYRCLLGHPD